MMQELKLASSLSTIFWSAAAHHPFLMGQGVGEHTEPGVDAGSRPSLRGGIMTEIEA